MYSDHVLIDPFHLHIIHTTCLPIFKCYGPDMIHQHMTLNCKEWT